MAQTITELWKPFSQNCLKIDWPSSERCKSNDMKLKFDPSNPPPDEVCLEIDGERVDISEPLQKFLANAKENVEPEDLSNGERYEELCYVHYGPMDFMPVNFTLKKDWPIIRKLGQSQQ